MGRTARALAGVLFFCCLSAVPARAGCTPDWEWRPKWNLDPFDDFVQVGFTYNGVSVRITKREGGKVYLKASNGATTEVAEADYTVVNLDCSSGKLPDWIKEDLNLPSEPPRQSRPRESYLAAASFDTVDVDGDGLEDVVSALFRPSGLFVEIARPEGGLNRPVSYPTRPGADKVVLADMNNDGRPDAVVSNEGDFLDDSGSISILLGLPNGRFTPAVHFNAGVAPTSLAAADFNGDGDIDIAVASRGSEGSPQLPDDDGSVSILLGGGDGSLGAPIVLETAGAPSSILALDLNRDDRVDLAVVRRGAGTLAIRLGQGDGTFATPIETAVGDSPTYLGAVDLNGDSRLDLVILHRRTSILSVWLADSPTRFRLSGRYVAGYDNRSFAFIQQPGDERPTILAPDGAYPRMLVFLANRDGSLIAPPANPVVSEPGGVAVADFNGDGRPDVVAGGRTGVSILLGQGEDRFSNERRRATTAGRISAVAAGDFDGDGHADVVAAHPDRETLSFLRGDGAGGLTAPVALPAAGGAQHLIAVDVNGDGSLDLVAANADSGAGSLSFYRGAGNGSFTRTDRPTGFASRQVALGDFTGDRRADAAVVNEGDFGGSSPSSVSILAGVAGGGFGPAIATIPVGFQLDSIATGDFNADGRLDLAVGGSLSQNFVFGVAVMLGAGNGSFGAPILTETRFGPAFLTADDFDGDGLDDLFVAHCCGDLDLTQMLSLGDGTFRQKAVPGGTDPVALALADFNADGVSDLVVANSPLNQPGVVHVLLNNLDPMTNVSAASSRRGGLPPDSIVTAYGRKLATETAAAPTPDWPTMLGGTRVRVRDAQGVERPARVAFASPGQVNYLMPPETAFGPARVTIIAADGAMTSALVAVSPVAPGLFTANTDGLAAAFVIRVKQDGAQLVENVVALDDQGRIVPNPIASGEESDRLILLLFGTGVRGRTSLNDVQVAIDGVEAPVAYAGPQGEFPGLDQINVEIPRSLAGRGVVDIVVRVAGEIANTLRIELN